jgi:WD40 repeat protein
MNRRGSIRKFAVTLVLMIMALASPSFGYAQGPQTIAINAAWTGYQLSISPDGKLAAAFANNNIYADEVKPELLPIILIDLTTGKETGRLQGTQTDFAGDAAFTPDGKQLAAFHNNGQLTLWDTSTAKLISATQTSLIGPHRVKFLPDGKTLVVLESGTLSRFYLWNIQDQSITRLIGPQVTTFKEFKDAMSSIGTYQYVAFDTSPDGKLLAAASPKGRIIVLDTATGTDFVLAKGGEQPTFTIMSIRFSADGKVLVYYNQDDKQTHVWDVSSKQDTPFAAGGPVLAISPDGKTLAWLAKDTVFSAPIDQPEKATALGQIGTLKPLPGIARMQFTPDGKSLILGGFAGDNPQIFIFKAA